MGPTCACFHMTRKGLGGPVAPKSVHRYLMGKSTREAWHWLGSSGQGQPEPHSPDPRAPAYKRFWGQDDLLEACQGHTESSPRCVSALGPSTATPATGGQDTGLGGGPGAQGSQSNPPWARFSPCSLPSGSSGRASAPAGVEDRLRPWAVWGVSCSPTTPQPLLPVTASELRGPSGKERVPGPAYQARAVCPPPPTVDTRSHHSHRRHWRPGMPPAGSGSGLHGAH